MITLLIISDNFNIAQLNFFNMTFKLGSFDTLRISSIHHQCVCVCVRADEGRPRGKMRKRESVCEQGCWCVCVYMRAGMCVCVRECESDELARWMRDEWRRCCPKKRKHTFFINVSSAINKTSWESVLALTLHGKNQLGVWWKCELSKFCCSFYVINCW